MEKRTFKAMLLDAHVHTDKYSEKLLEDVIRECEYYNICLMSVSMCIPSYKKIRVLSNEYDFIIPSFGIHPWKAKEYSRNLSSLDEYLYLNKYIGEIGLDKKFLDYTDPYKDQLKVFEYIVSHEAVNDKLLNLHTSGAELEVLSFLKRYNRNKFIVHWYAGDIYLIKEYLALGGYFSVGVEILFNEYIQNIAREIPLERMLVETDNPSSYSWLLGKGLNNGMPSLLYKVVDKICEIKQLCRNNLLEILKANQYLILR